MITKEQIEERAKKFGYTNLFACPESAEALMEYVERFNGTEKIAAMVVMGMTANFYAKKLARMEYNLLEGENEKS